LRTLSGTRAAAFHPVNPRHIAVVRDNGVKLWDWVADQEVRWFPGGPSVPWDILFSPHGKELVCLGWNDKKWEVKRWDVASGQELKGLSGPQHPWDTVRGLAYSPDSKRLATHEFAQLCIWDLERGKDLVVLAGPC